MWFELQAEGFKLESSYAGGNSRICGPENLSFWSRSCVKHVVGSLPGELEPSPENLHREPGDLELLLKTLVERVGSIWPGELEPWPGELVCLQRF